MLCTTQTLLLTILATQLLSQVYPLHIESDAELFMHFMKNEDFELYKEEAGPGATYILSRLDTSGNILSNEVIEEYNKKVSNVCLGLMVKISSLDTSFLRGSPDKLLFTFILEIRPEKGDQVEANYAPLFANGLIDSSTLIFDPFTSIHYRAPDNNSVLGKDGYQIDALDKDASYKELISTDTLQLAPGLTMKAGPRFDSSHHPKSQYKLGLTFLEEGKYEDAIEALSFARRGFISDPKLYYNRGIAYYNAGQQKKACKDWSRAAELGSKEGHSRLQEHCGTY